MDFCRFLEVFKDPKALAFFFWPALGCLVGGIGVQYSLIIRAFGFTVLQTTLLAIPGGMSQVIGIAVGIFALRKFPVRRTWLFKFINADCLPQNSRTAISLLAYIPIFLGGALLLGLPITNKIGLICGIYIVRMYYSFVRFR